MAARAVHSLAGLRSLSIVVPLLLGVALPAAVAAAVLLVVGRRGGPCERASGGCWGGAVAIGAGYLAGHVLVMGRPTFPPPEVTAWLFYLTWPVMGAAVVKGRRTRWAVRAAVSGAAVWLLLRPIARHSWGMGECVLGLGGLFAAMLVFWSQMEGLAHRAKGVSLPLSLFVAVAGAGAVLLLSGSVVLSRLCGALSAALAAAALVAWRRPGVSLAGGGVSVVAVLFASLLICGYFYVQASATSVILLALAPAVAWVGQVPGVRRITPWKIAIVRIAAVLVPVGAAVTIAWCGWDDPYG